jgi:hypothetical protein
VLETYFNEKLEQSGIRSTIEWTQDLVASICSAFAKAVTQFLLVFLVPATYKNEETMLSNITILWNSTIKQLVAYQLESPIERFSSLRLCLGNALLSVIKSDIHFQEAKRFYASINLPVESILAKAFMTGSVVDDVMFHFSSCDWTETAALHASGDKKVESAMKRLKKYGIEELTPCTNQFYLSMGETQETEDFLVFKHPMPDSRINELFIRPSYREIGAAIIMDTVNHVILSGTPGIGKSLFFYYLEKIQRK